MEPTLALTRLGTVRRWYDNYPDAEYSADIYKRDVQPEGEVYVIKHLQRQNYALVIGWSDMPGDKYCDDYEIIYTTWN